MVLGQATGAARIGADEFAIIVEDIAEAAMVSDVAERVVEQFEAPFRVPQIEAPFRVVDRLVTNFHVPGSTLVVMIAAFMGDGWRPAYDAALARGYRFLSFGDAMLADRR